MKVILLFIFLLELSLLLFAKQNTEQDYVDKFYCNLKENKMTSTLNQITLRREFIFDSDSIVKTQDTSYYVLYKKYNLYKSANMLNYSDSSMYVVIDLKKQNAYIDRFSKKMKYPLLYSIVDIEDLSYMYADSINYIFKKYLEKFRIPLERDYILYYFNRNNEMLQMVEYYYHNVQMLKSARLYFTYSSVKDNNATLSTLLFTPDGQLKAPYSEFNIIDNRR